MKSLSALSTAVLSLASLVALVAACSSSDGAPAGGGASSSTSSSGGPAGPSLNSTAYVTALCDQTAKCEMLSGGVLDKTRCMREAQAAIDGANGAPGVTLTQAQVDACAAKLPSLACDPSFAEPADLVPECAWHGTLAAGSGCEYGVQCASGRCLVTDPDAFCGKCADRGDVGATCSGDPGDCKAGLDCDGAPGKCAARPAKGAACTRTGVSCQGDSVCIKSVCSDPLAENAACTPEDNGCGIGLDCMGTKCVKHAGGTTLVKVGEECGPDPDATYFRDCMFGASCVGRGPSKCVTDAKVGEACGGATEVRCELLAHCDKASQKCIKDDPASCK